MSDVRSRSSSNSDRNMTSKIKGVPPNIAFKRTTFYLYWIMCWRQHTKILIRHNSAICNVKSPHFIGGTCRCNWLIIYNLTGGTKPYQTGLIKLVSNNLKANLYRTLIYYLLKNSLDSWENLSFFCNKCIVTMRSNVLKKTYRFFIHLIADKYIIIRTSDDEIVEVYLKLLLFTVIIIKHFVIFKSYYYCI